MLNFIIFALVQRIRNTELRNQGIVFHRFEKSVEKASPTKRQDEAFTAIELRYCISRGRTENIIYETIRQDGAMYKTLFRMRNEQLRELLEDISDETTN